MTNKHIIDVKSRSIDLFYCGSLSDFSIKLGDDVFECHKVMLYCGSEFFKGFFNFNSNAKEISLDNNIVTFIGIQNCLKYIYNFGYDCEFKTKEYREIYISSDFLQIYSLKAIISNKIASKVKSKNAFKLYALSLMYNDKQLEMKVRNFINNNFNNLFFNCSEYLQLDYDSLKCMLQDKNLSSTDYHIINALILWISFDKLNRQNFVIKDLKEIIHLNLISSEQWTELMKNHCNNIDFISEIQKLPTNQNKDLNHRLGTPVHLFCLGGETTQSDTGLIENMSYVSSTEHINLPKMHYDRVNHKICSSNIYIYVIGGDNVESGYIYRSCERFNLIEKCWEIMPDLDNDRSSFTIVAVEGFVYLFGGYITHDSLPSEACLDILVYDSATNDKWILTPFHTPHSLIDAVATNCKGQIFIAGGETNQHGNSGTQYLPQIYEWDPADGQWTKLTTNGLPRLNSFYYCPSLTCLSFYNDTDEEQDKDCLILSLCTGHEQNNRYHIYTYNFRLNRWRHSLELPKILPKQFVEGLGNGDTKNTRIRISCFRDLLAIVGSTDHLIKPFWIPGITDYTFILSTDEPTSKYSYVQFRLDSSWSGELDLANVLFHRNFLVMNANKIILAPLVNMEF